MDYNVKYIFFTVGAGTNNETCIENGEILLKIAFEVYPRFPPYQPTSTTSTYYLPNIRV